MCVAYDRRFHAPLRCGQFGELRQALWRGNESKASLDGRAIAVGPEAIRCQSARGPNADRRRNLLIGFTLAGSTFGACS